MMDQQTKYNAVREALLGEISQASPGTRLPSQSELMKRFSVSYSTITRAIDELRNMGAIITQQGRGTFVANQSGAGRAQPKRTIGAALHWENWHFMGRILSSFFEEAAKAGWAVLLPQQPGIDFQTTVSA